jgi:hypothetical protein
MKFFRQVIVMPFFLLLLPFYFVFHGYVQNKASVTTADAFSLGGEYFLATVFLFLIGLALFRSWPKAALFAFGLMFLHLFFGAFHDGLTNISPGFFLSRYVFLLPFLLCLVIGFAIFLKRTFAQFRRLFLYLNLVFLLLILLDVPLLVKQKKNSYSSPFFAACDTCQKPDVYLIIADEYADSASLAQTMQFNNGGFQEQLRRRGFHVVEESHSNYNYTPFAMASLFQMNYLPGITGQNSNQTDRNICAEAINENPVINFFKQNGYAIRNLSIFNVDKQQSQVRQNYLLLGKDLIAAHTFLRRLRRDLGFHLVTTFKLQSEIERYFYYTKKCNEQLIRLLQEESTAPSRVPRFVYTHFLIPHYPYYYDAAGKERPLSFFSKNYEFNLQAYTEYLRFGNGIFLQLIDSILQHAKTPPVIIFMGDHGFREYAKPVDMRYHYMNMNAVFLPNKNYLPFYPGLCTVNQFRALFNASFGQQLPMLKDSTILIQE